MNEFELGVRQTENRSAVPPTVQASKWYTERTLNDLRKLRYFIEGLDGDARLIADSAFSAILLPVCRETRHWGYVCDNTDPKGDYERDVFEAYERTLGGFAEAYSERDAYWHADHNWPSSECEVEIIEGDAGAILSGFPKKSVQLIVTSSPYFGVTDYVKAQRLPLEWHGKPIEPLRLSEIGARSKRHRMAAADEYLRECKHVFEECRRVLEKGRACVVIFGESAERAPVHTKFVQIVEACGFKLRHSRSRQISVRRRLTPRLHVEKLLVFT